MSLIVVKHPKANITINIKMKEFARYIAINSSQSPIIPNIRIFFLPYMSLNLGSQGSVQNQPTKTIEPIRPSYQLGLHVKSNFSTQLCKEYILFQSTSYDLTLLPSHILS